MPTPDRLSSFTSESAREAFYALYDQLLDDLWPVPITAEDVGTRFGVVRIYRAGPVGDDPVVLISGAGGNALAWYAYVEPLASTHHVVVVDPLGELGRSVQTRPITTGVEAGSWLSDVLATIGAERAHVVGSSFGGWTALEQQLADGGRVEAVTLVDPAGFAAASGRFYRWIIAGGLAALLPRPLRRRAAGWLGNGTLREDALMRMVFAGRTFRRRLPVPAVYTDTELRSVWVPVQVLLGARSALHAAEMVSQRLGTVVPRWRVEIIPGTGHALPLEAPELVIDRILTFVGDRRPDTDSTDSGESIESS